jgi:hypothetical protein
MTSMQTAPEPAARATRVALALMLVAGNLFFFGCIASRYAGTPADRPGAASQPARIVLAAD